MDRRTFLSIATHWLPVLPLAALAQQPRSEYRVGMLRSGDLASYAQRMDALRQALRDLGWTNARTVMFEERNADERYERLPRLAAELVALNVNVIVTVGTPATKAAKDATTTIPIVMVNTGDAVATGLVASLARPGGNVTGSTIFSPQLMAKRLELVKETLPRARLLAVILNPANPAQALSFEAAQSTARSLGIGLHKFEARGPDELEGIFLAMAKQRVDAVVTPQDGMIDAHARQIATLASKMHIPSVGNNALAIAGGLIGYGVDTFEMFRRAGYYIDKILKGANPGDMPVEQPTKFELIINLRTAKALGLVIPPSVLVRADNVIQ